MVKTGLVTNSVSSVVNPDIVMGPRSMLEQNVGMLSTNIPGSRSYNIANNYGAEYGGTVVSNKTGGFFALDNIKTKHQESFGIGFNGKRRTQKFSV